MTTTACPAELAADLLAHGIDPARVAIRDTRTRWGNGDVWYRIAGTTRETAVWPAVAWLHDPALRVDRWALKCSGRYVRDADGEVRLFASAGAALAWEE